MNIKIDPSPRPHEVFESSMDFFKYFRKTMALLRDEEKKEN